MAAALTRVRGAKRGAGDPAIAQVLSTAWRFWASLPPTVTAVAALADPAAPAKPIAVVARPRFPRGVCKRCGCTWTDPCVGGCAWTDTTETLCTECA